MYTKQGINTSGGYCADYLACFNPINPAEDFKEVLQIRSA
jgi:hypothetical protein